MRDNNLQKVIEEQSKGFREEVQLRLLKHMLIEYFEETVEFKKKLLFPDLSEEDVKHIAQHLDAMLDQ